MFWHISTFWGRAKRLGFEQDGQAAQNLADQNAELKALFAVEAISVELWQLSEDSSPED